MIRRREFCGLSSLLVTGCLWDGGGLNLSPSSEVNRLPRTEFDIVVENEVGRIFRGGPYNWKLTKVTDTGEYVIQPNIQGGHTAYTLQSGESYSWPVRIDNEDRTMLREDAVATQRSLEYTGLGPGEYVFETYGTVEGGLIKGSDDVTLSTRFELGGEPITLETTGLVEETTTSDGGLVEIFREDASETVTVERSGHEAPELILEQVMQIAPLRDALYYLERNGKETAVVHTPSHRPLALLDHYEATDLETGYRFSYEGEGYKVEFDEAS